MDLQDWLRYSGVVILLTIVTTVGAADPEGLGEQILDLRARNVDGGGNSPLRSLPGELAEAVEQLAADPPRNHFHPAPALEDRLRERRPDKERKKYRTDADLPPQRSILRPSSPHPQPPKGWPPHRHEQPSRHEGAGAQRLLQETAFQLETLAHRLEMHELYDQADSLRKAAGGLRKEARKQGRRHSDPGPPLPDNRSHYDPGP